jgi:phage/plasmid-associated DNA primase
MNEIDSWQVIPFLKGIAGSGKSTIITKALKKFYECEDVKTLSNNIEKKFGLWSIDGCFMFISPEVKGDLALEQAEFQSIVSGEDISIARKNEKAITKEWKTPGILAGNEVPNWKDNSGSIQRRIVVWNFTKQVTDADPKLDEKLDTELASLLQKCVKAYLDYTKKYGDKDIWSVLPKYFKDMRKKIASSTNSLQHFLESEKITYNSSAFIPQKVFVNIFMAHCQENNLLRPRGFNDDTYAAPFMNRDIEVRVETVNYRGTNYMQQPIIYGLDVNQLPEADI